MIFARISLPIIFILLNVFNPITGADANCSEHYDMDYILLVLQWPESFCETTQCRTHDDVWGIHGAWPQYYSGKWPQDCCFEKDFEPTKISSIQTELTKKWGSLKASGTSEEFWSHEWTKHGTCAMKSDLLKGELNYFKNSLNAFNELSIDKWLTDANITPSESKAYDLNDFLSALSKGLGHQPRVECLTKKHNDSPIVSEINVCLNKDTLLPFNCPNSVTNKHCGTDTVAYLPSKK